MNTSKYIVPFYTIVYCLLYFVLALVLYILSLFFGYDGISLPLFAGGDDGAFYLEQAVNVANEQPAVLTSIHILIFGYIFKLFNTENVIILKGFNYIGNVLLVLLTLLILKKSTGYKGKYNTSAIILVSLLLFYPSLILNSSLSIYRDVWIFLYFLGSIYFFSNIFIVKSKYPILLNFLSLLFFIVMLGSYRKYALLSFLIASALYILFNFRNKRGINFKKILFTSLVGFTFAYSFLRKFKVPYVGLSFQDVLSYRQSSLEAGGSQMGISLDHANILSFYFNYFYSLISNTIGPLPWQVNSAATLVVFLTESIIFVVIMLFLYKQRKSFSKLDMYLIMQSTIWFMLISISNDNIGTAARLRIVGWLPLIIIFSKHFSSYLFLRKQRKKAREF
ncbi:hypothetical protein [Psychrobacillus sp. L3]|uniref:hypothetical protein n=1 Tax=Psychrobacillus sp. L3 TaxID=3236891 RepID=UPI0036F3906D